MDSKRWKCYNLHNSRGDFRGFQAVLCGDKVKYSGIFERAGYHKIKNSFVNGVEYFKKASFGKQEFLTTKAWNLLSYRDKVSLFNGYFSADGSHTRSSPRVWTSDERVLSMICDISCLAGYHIFSITKKVEDTNYKKDRVLFHVSLTKRHDVRSPWKVLDIKRKDTSRDYEAWCVEEPVTNSFTLDGGIVTGNCLSLPLDDLLRKGFNTRQTDVRPANSVNTAFQLVAVTFQLQSLNQFGGVAATHLDHTMVPYVRKSFYKHFKDGLKYVENYAGDIKDLGISKRTSIVDKKYKNFSKAYSYAYEMTERETYQAVEGMYHNLNTLQSRSGDQLM